MYNDIRLSQSMLDEADQDTSLEVTSFTLLLLLTLLLPRVSKIKIQDKSQISFCKILKHR